MYVPHCAVFHRLVLNLSTSSPILPLEACATKVFDSYSTIFSHLYRLPTTTTSIHSMLSTYLAMSANVTRVNTEKGPNKTPKPLEMDVRAKSIFFSLIPSSFTTNNNSLTIFLSDCCSYSIPCSIEQESVAKVDAAATRLLARIRFALNSSLQVMCVVTHLYEQEEVGTINSWERGINLIKFLAAPKETRYCHMPLVKESEEKNQIRTMVFRKSKDRNEVTEQQVVFHMWKMMKCKESEEFEIEQILTDLKHDDIIIDAEEVLRVADKYEAVFTVTDRKVVLKPPSPSYWSQILLLCDHITPTTTLRHLPLSPLNLGVSVLKEKVVLRDLQGLVLASGQQHRDRIFTVKFRVSNSGSGFTMNLHHSSLKIPAEGKVIPLTLVMEMNKDRLVVVGSMGSWMQFRPHFPQKEFLETFVSTVDKDLEMLVDDIPTQILSMVVEENDIITIEDDEEHSVVPVRDHTKALADVMPEWDDTDDDDADDVGHRVMMGPLANEEIDYEEEAEMVSRLTKIGKNPLYIRRRNDGSVQRRWWAQIHDCHYLFEGCDYETEDELHFDNHMMDHGIEEGEKKFGKGVYMCPNEWCDEWTTRSLVSLRLHYEYCDH